MRCAVIGDPVSHSLSPVIHQAGYDATGLTDWSYQAVRVEAGRVREFLDGLDDDWRGISVTAPHKREALGLASSLTDRARLAGGVNTLARTQRGWAGDNTDLPGAQAAIRERFPAPLSTAAVLGGGATAASVGLALVELGVRQIEVAVRDPARASETVTAIAAHPARPSVRPIPLASVGLAGPLDIVVSTIPASAQTADAIERWRTNGLLGAQVLFEVTYDPWPTPLVQAATAAGAIVVSGLDLLVHQASLQFEQFTGIPGPLEAMRAAGLAALR